MPHIEAESDVRLLDPRPARKARDQELARSGWMRRFCGAPPRLSEMKDLYQALGWEVHLDELLADELPGHCADCRAALSLFRVLYTRRPRDQIPRTGGAS